MNSLGGAYVKLLENIAKSNMEKKLKRIALTGSFVDSDIRLADATGYEALKRKEEYYISITDAVSDNKLETALKNAKNDNKCRIGCEPASYRMCIEYILQSAAGATQKGLMKKMITGEFGDEYRDCCCHILKALVCAEPNLATGTRF